MLRPASADDAELLVAWHADPEVARYWDAKVYTREAMLAKLAQPDFFPWIVEAGGEPVGYLQVWSEPGDTRTAGVDGFLVPTARGRGLMPDAARALARRLLDEGWEDVTVDPYVWNERAIRGWRNAGFVEVSRHPADDEHSAEWVLMRFAPSQVPDPAGSGT
ncbi:MAG TPA: GNAT family N-acetyltransferase [Gaiellaceae bacterium]|nr:GNAT family N-acetyltransferase [Gaiellaceae bacterium]